MALKGEGKGPLPPLLEQYVELCAQYPDYLLLFQVGDFYETFGEDAERLARLIDIVLTRKTSKDFVTPMAGIPLKSADTYIEKLLAKGIRVAVADQVGNPKVEGLVNRDISQLITPGTVTEARLLKPDANYLAAIATGDGYGVALLDVSTGEFRAAHVYAVSSLYDELRRYHPAEVLLSPELYNQEAFREAFSKRFPVMVSSGRFELTTAKEVLLEQFGANHLATQQTDAVSRAAGAVLSYALETQRGQLPQVTKLERYDPSSYMQLGEVALTTLEIFESQRGTREQSLFAVLDDTRTAPGRRLLNAWLRHPLLDASQINKRLDAVSVFVHDGVLRADVRRDLYKMHDLARIASRLAAGRASARDLVALARSLRLIPHLQTLLATRPEPVLQALLTRLDGLVDIHDQVSAALVDDPPLKITEGGLIKDGVDDVLDDLRHSAESGRTFIAALEASERARTGIPTLKVGFNGVFGYYFEVTRPYYDDVPDDYHALQTLKDRQRYVRADLRDKEREISRAEVAAQSREYEVFQALREVLIHRASDVRDVSDALAELDVYTALAEVAANNHYCRPEFGEVLEIHAGRHPVVERYHSFIANDLHLSTDARLVMLTGPNMSGKSTFLRQNALIALLAQIGSFVPAEHASLPIFSTILTRIGASDDLAGGRSTFMVEMDELADILAQASTHSLVVLDELGRGTSTFDGLSLAWAASEYLHDHAKAYTLIATHYFELTGLANRLPAARNYHVAAKEEAGGLMFYHQVLPGPASKSYGLQVAKLAGLPSEVLARAEVLLASLEADRDTRSSQISECIAAQDLSRLTPMDALKLLHSLQDMVHGVENNTDIPETTSPEAHQQTVVTSTSYVSATSLSREEPS
ncbi:MAG: DNA mismatch repair protein MutS [Deinococcota bacterium]